MRKTRSKKNSFNWNKVQRFSIRKLSFGVASCMIGAHFVLSGLSNPIQANGVIADEANGDRVTLYAHGENVYNLQGKSAPLLNAFLIDVDTSKYTKENPEITINFTYNARGPEGSGYLFFGGRPMFWFTVPEAVQELGGENTFSLTNKHGKADLNNWTDGWNSTTRIVRSKYNGNPDAWERYNTTTGETLRKGFAESLNREFNKVLGDHNTRWYDNSNMPTRDIMKDLRNKTHSIYIDWESRTQDTITMSYKTRVKDPENTKELTIGMGVYQKLGEIQYARVETIKLPTLYKLNEAFEPKIPERTEVTNPTNLTDEEVNTIKGKIWKLNKDEESPLLSTNKLFKDNVKDNFNNGVNSITIDKTTGNATITYKDDTTDTIEGSKLIYKKTDPAKPVTPSEGLKQDDGQNLKYYSNPVEVESFDNISNSDRKNALDSFLKANLTQAGYNKYNSENALTNDDLKSGVNFNLANGKKATLRMEVGNYISILRQSPYGNLGLVPREQLFRVKPKPTFDVDAARTEANKLIDSLANLYPDEKKGYKDQIASATDRKGIENVINTAKTKDNENAVELAKMKKEANAKINSLVYLANDEKEAAIVKINSATIKHGDADVDSAATADKTDTDANRDETKARLNSIVTALESTNLQKAKDEAIKTINNIPNEDLSSDKKTAYITAINNANKVGPASDEGTILNIVDKAQKEAADALAKRRKDEADKVRQQYKDMIAAIPGLTEEEKKQYNDAIDNAPNVDEMASIVEYAKLSGKRKNAIEELGKLTYLNNAQKKAFTDAINDSSTKAELDNYVSEATLLNSKMKQLNDLATQARDIKTTDKYTSAETNKKTAFDNALQDAESVLNKETGADKAITSVEKLFKALETAINELKPGSEPVKVDVDKSVLQAEYDKGTTVKSSVLYTNSVDEGEKTAQQRKEEYDSKLVAAKDVLNDSNANQTAVDKALDDLLSAKAGLNGKETEFTLSKKDENPVPISIEPAVGAVNLSPADKELVKDKINGIPTGAQVIYNPIVEKGNKKYVPVKVTHENVSKEIKIEVVQSVASKVTPTVSTAKLSVVPKENDTITKEADVQKVKDAVKLPKVPEGQPQPTKELVDGGKVVQGTDQSANGGANNTGKLVVKVEVKYPDGSNETVEVPVEASDAAKATPKLKEEITSGEVPVSVDPANDNQVAEADKKAITDAVVVPKDEPQPKDKQVKNDGAIVEGTGANKGKKVVVVEVTYPDGSKDEIEVPVRKATDKDKAKADLTKAVDAEKAEIDGDNALSKKEKEALKKQVDELKAKHEENINKATSQEDIASATEKGRQEIAAVHTPKDITETAKRRLNPPTEKVKVTDINHLTKEEKAAVKKAIVATNPSLEESEVYVSDKGDVASPKGYLEAEKVVVQALNKPATPVVVADPSHLTPTEKDKVKEAVANANPGLNKDDITVDDKGNVTTKNGDKLLAKDVVTPALKRPTTPVVVENPDSLTEKDKENIQNAVVEANKDSNLKPGDVTVNPDGSVSTPNGKLPKEDVITTVIKRPTTLVVVENPNRLTVKEKEDIKKAVADANPGLTEDKIKVDDQGYVQTPLGNLEPKDVITSALKKPTTPVNVNNPSKLTEVEKAKVVEEIVKNNPDLAGKEDKINVDDQGNVETPKGNLPAGEVVAPSLKKPTTPVIVKDPNKLTDGEKEAIKDAIVAVNPDLADKKDKIKVDNQGNVETPKGNLPKEDVVTIVLNKPTAPVVVKNPDSLTDEEKDKVKDAVAKANPGLNKKDIEVDNQGNVKIPNGGLPAKDVITSNLNKPTTPVEVKDPNKLTDEAKDKVKDEVAKANPGLDKKDITVDNQGNVETPKGNLLTGDVVTPVLNVPTKPIVVGNPESLTEKEKEEVKNAVSEANPGLDKKVITVDDKGNVTTPNGNIPAEYIVKASKGASVTRPVLPELSVQDALVAGEVAVEKGNEIKDEDVLKQLTLVEGAVTAKVISKPNTTETGTKEAEVEITLANGNKVTIKVPVKVYEGERPEVNDLAKAKEDAKKQVEEAANKKNEEINKRTDLSDPEKAAAIEKVNKAKEDAKSQIENATSAGTAKAIGEEAAKKITEFQPEHDSVKLVDPSKLDEEKAKAIAEIEQAAKDQTDAIKNNAGLTPSQKEEAIKKIEDLKAKAIEDVRKATTKDEVANVVKEVETAIKKVDPQPQPGNNGGNGGNSSNAGSNTGNTSNQNAQENSDALANARKAAENILDEAERAKKAQLEEAELSADEKAELFAKVEAEKQEALDEIAKAKDVEEVKQLVTKAVAKIKAIQPARNAQDNQGSQDAQNAQGAQNEQNGQDAQNYSSSNPTSLAAANVRGQELPATGTGNEFVVFNAAAISILTGLGLAIPSKKKETEE